MGRCSCDRGFGAETLGLNEVGPRSVGCVKIKPYEEGCVLRLKKDSKLEMGLGLGPPSNGNPEEALGFVYGLWEAN